jgi:salicylate hydroxylase
VNVFEQTSVLSEVGAGIQISPNAMHAFMALGLENEVLTSSFEPNSHVVKNWQDGRTISSTPLKGVLKNKFGAGYYGFHRADLHRTLIDALPKDCIKLGTQCTKIENVADRVILYFSDGSISESDIVIGADGIHSVVAESLFGRQLPQFTGNICWRGLVPTGSLPPDLISKDMSVYFGPNAHVVTYYVRGGQYVNWFASCRQDNWRHESWKQEVSYEEVIDAYKGWCPILTELFSKSERCYKWALFDRDPRPQWTKGRVTILGDAAHPMLPSLAQGACMAVEDAYVIAQSLDRHKQEPERALQVYEAARRPRTSQVQLLARARSQINQLASPRAQLLRNVGYAIRRWINPTKHTYGIEWIYGYDVKNAISV